MNALLQISLTNAVVAAGMALIVLVITRWWKNRQVAHLLWLMVLAEFVTPPLWYISLPLVTENGSKADLESDSNNHGSQATDRSDAVTSAPTVLESDDVGSERTEIATRIDGPASSAVLWLWITTSVLCLLISLLRIARFHRIVSRADPADKGLMSRARELAARLGLRKVPNVRLLDGDVTPMVWPLCWRRVVLLPRKLVDELTPAQLDTVLAHEFAHLVRRDELVRFIEAAATCTFWWNPVVWLARRQLHAAEEDCCDALVVYSMPGSRREYGEALLCAAELVSFGGSLPVLASGLGQEHVLKWRIRMVLNHEFGRSLSLPTKLGLLLASVVILPLAGTGMSQDLHPFDGNVTHLADSENQEPQQGWHSFDLDGIKVSAQANLRIGRFGKGAVVPVGSGRNWFGDVPDNLAGRLYIKQDPYQGFVQFRVTRPQRVTIALYDWRRSNDGNSSGGWREELVTEGGLLQNGWKKIAILKALYVTPDGFVGEQDRTAWHAYTRDCKAGESFRIRNHKYQPPVIFASRREIPNGPKAIDEPSGVPPVRKKVPGTQSSETPPVRERVGASPNLGAIHLEPSRLRTEVDTAVGEPGIRRSAPATEQDLKDLPSFYGSHAGENRRQVGDSIHLVGFLKTDIASGECTEIYRCELKGNRIHIVFRRNIHSQGPFPKQTGLYFHVTLPQLPSGKYEITASVREWWRRGRGWQDSDKVTGTTSGTVTVP